MCEQTRVLPEYAGCQAGRQRVDPSDKSSSLWWRLTGPSRHARQANNLAAGEGVYASVKPSAKRLPQARLTLQHVVHGPQGLLLSKQPRQDEALEASLGTRLLANYSYLLSKHGYYQPR